MRVSWGSPSPARNRHPYERDTVQEKNVDVGPTQKGRRSTATNTGPGVARPDDKSSSHTAGGYRLRTRSVVAAGGESISDARPYQRRSRTPIRSSHVDKDKQGTLAFVRIVGQRVRERREAGGLTQSRLERDAELRPTTGSR